MEDPSPQQTRRHWVHEFFEIGIFLKALNGALEVVGGVVLLFIPIAKIHALLFFITAGEIADDPSDALANSVRHFAENYSTGGQHFLVAYFMSHGAAKLILTYLLFKEKLWAFPAALSVFSLLVMYEAYRFIHTHSPFLLSAVAFDLFIIFFIWSEYRYRAALMRVP